MALDAEIMSGTSGNGRGRHAKMDLETILRGGKGECCDAAAANGCSADVPFNL
jgi:hypothetical protein